MPVIRVDRFDDPRLAEYRTVTDGELLRRRHRFVAEGRLVVARLLESGHCVESLLVNDASFRALEELLSRVSPHMPIYVCETEEFAAITGFNLHRGCLALAERPDVRPFQEVMRGADLLLVLEAVTDADNVGSAFRNAAAFGASVLLSEACCDPLYRKAIRTSMGSTLRTPYARLENWPRDLATLKSERFTLVALTPRADAIDLPTCARKQHQRLALLVGSEGPGLSAEAEALADVCVRIPIAADVDSLNLATATGIALYYFTNHESQVPNP
ncbi:MAG TPA: RNA methyltransferase [Vicinamibacterales bacterium]|nr:RNA methyltransferase [Vicinamibacterales bacterium]